ncbi:olfactory receptor-like protein OLF3 [Engystomops pustulosus]|uniref:olfactory receptor-like protein OLF3 n=1 Tax=Engystomops pustulosus TaxID=76066 RepID=UPI003AFAE46B
MKYMNETSSYEFILIGLSTDPSLQPLYFTILLMMYMVTLTGNILIIVVVKTESRLQTPMYFFLSNLSLIDLCFSTTIVPKLLVSTLAEDRSISFWGCAAQMYFHLALGGTECIILALMAYDRYVAICHPLHYNSIMNLKLCLLLSVGTWSFNFLNSIYYAYITFRLPYCRSRHVNHYFCEMPPLFRLSCTDTLMDEIAVYISGGIVGLCSFVLTLMSYVQIISTILKIRSSTGRRKAFSTCVSHLSVVSLYYGAIVFTYLRPRGSYSVDRDRAVSILYTVVTPMFNPIIYSIRNKEVKGSVRKLFVNRFTQSEDLHFSH